MRSLSRVISNAGGPGTENNEETTQGCMSGWLGASRIPGICLLFSFALVRMMDVCFYLQFYTDQNIVGLY